MKKYDFQFSISFSCDENGANCSAEITHLSQNGGMPMVVDFEKIVGNNREEVLGKATKMVEDWIDNQK